MKTSTSFNTISSTRNILLPATASIIFILSSCSMATVGSKGTTLNTDVLAKAIETRIKNNVTGYQIAIFAKGTFGSAIAGGAARKFPDAGARNMTNNDKINVASLSKTITAAALLIVLAEKSVSINSPMYPYLPSHWVYPASVKKITFRQLLRHSAGFDYDDLGETYADLKTLVEKGPTIDTFFHYKNDNYALMRILIANLSGAKITPVKFPPFGGIENIQAQEYGDAYMNYCRSKIFDKLGIWGKDMNCKPADANAALCYKWAAPAGHGTDFGDMSLTSAARGWNMSSMNMSAFLNVLTTTDKIVPKAVANEMLTDSLGFDLRKVTGKGITFTAKAGGYPASMNPGAVEAWIFVFDNGVEVTVIVNSDYKNNESGVYNEVVAAFDEWYK